MAHSLEREKIMDEVKRIPENRLAEIYSLLHYFRIGIEQSRETLKPIMQFAGAWSGMPEEIFSDFMSSITTRRHEAFAGRRVRETNAD